MYKKIQEKIRKNECALYMPIIEFIYILVLCMKILKSYTLLHLT